MAEMKARITLDDNVSAEIIKPIDAINKLKESATNASEAINSISNKKVNINSNEAIDKIKSIKENAENITKKKFEVALNAVDKTKDIISKVKSGLGSITKTPATAVIKAKDETVATISKVREGLMSLKTLAAGIVLGEAGKNTIGAASQLEQEQIAMKHFIAYNNQKSSSTDVQKMTDDYISKLRVEANATPFSTNEVISAGRRAVNITSGDTKQGMDLVKLSENMAALNPGKSVMDAMEALADAKTGEYERMKEFGFKITQADVQKAGGTDQYFKTQFSNTGNVGKVFKGGADELSKTTAGNWSTVTGNLESIGANFGKAFLPVINKVLTPLAALLDKNADKFTNFGESIVKVGSKVGTLLAPAFKKVPELIDKYLMPTIKFIQQISNKYILPAIEAVAGVIKQYLPPIVQAIGAFAVKMGPILKKGWDIIQTYIIPIIQDLWGKVKDIMPGVQSLIESAFKVAAGAIKIAVDIFGGVAPVIKGMWDIISPILDGIITLFNRVADAIKAAVDWLDNWNGKEVKDNTPRSNTTPGSYDLITGKKNQSFNFYTQKKNALGTNYFEGGMTWINEVGPELVELPGGTKIHSNRETKNMLNPKNDDMSNQFAKNGEDIPASLAKGIKKTTPTLINTMAASTQSLIETFGSGITDNSKYPIKSTQDLTKNVTDVFTILGNNSNPLGQNVSQGLGQGMKDSESNVVDIAKTLTDKVIKAFTDGFDIHSPSKVMYAIGGHVMQGFVNGLNSKDLKAFADKHIQTITSAFGGASGSLAGWVSTAMALTGVGPEWFSPLMTLIQHESGGDPNSVNLWDYNAQHGDPSRGLMQLTGENMRDWHLPGMDNINDPVSNIAAGIRLIQHDYGNIYNTPGIKALSNGGNYVGYANGGISDRPAIFGEGQYAEAAIPLKKNSSRSQQLLDIADNYVNGDKKSSGKNDKDVNLIINFNGVTVGEEEFFDKAGEHIVKKVRLAIQNL